MKMYILPQSGCENNDVGVHRKLDGRNKLVLLRQQKICHCLRGEMGSLSRMLICYTSPTWNPLLAHFCTLFAFCSWRLMAESHCGALKCAGWRRRSWMATARRDKAWHHSIFYFNAVEELMCVFFRWLWILKADMYLYMRLKPIISYTSIASMANLIELNEFSVISQFCVHCPFWRAIAKVLAHALEYVTPNCTFQEWLWLRAPKIVAALLKLFSISFLLCHSLILLCAPCRCVLPISKQHIVFDQSCIVNAASPFLCPDSSDWWQIWGAEELQSNHYCSISSLPSFFGYTRLWVLQLNQLLFAPQDKTAHIATPDLVLTVQNVILPTSFFGLALKKIIKKINITLSHNWDLYRSFQRTGLRFKFTRQVSANFSNSC